MLRISNIKLDINEDISKVRELVLKKLKINEKDLIKYHIYKESIDARKKGKIEFVYTVDVDLKNEKAILNKSKIKDVIEIKQSKYIDLLL